MTVSALIVAAGRGERFGEEVPKQYAVLGGIPVLRRSVLAFVHHPSIDRVYVAVRKEDEARYEESVAGLQLEPPIIGGATRQETVRIGLSHMQDSPPTIVLIHDAARPFVTSEIISRVIEASHDNDGAVPALPVTDSLKRATGKSIKKDVSRDGLWRVQTPQGFRYERILAAHAAASRETFTDDAGVACAYGLRVELVEGDEENFKITTPADLRQAERQLLAGMPDVRFGQGFDVHRLEPGDHVRLCGIDIPHVARLVGHSDADVAMHALTDALLGTIAAGDIGRHFPPSEEKWRNVDSATFLCRAMDLIRERGGLVQHVDVTIICEVPKIAPHREKMCQRLADLMKISVDRVSVKATTTEGLGITGQREGIAAQAVATVRLPVA